MKKIKAILCLILCLAALTSMLPAAAAYGDYSDAAGHWAENDLRRAVEDGLLVGDGEHILPNSGINRAQAAVIINNVLGAEVKERAEGESWYRPNVDSAVSLGYLTDGSAQLMERAMTRSEVFVILARAFGLTCAQTDETVMNRFSDVSGLTGEARRSACALAELGIATGNAGKLLPQKTVTRAEFIALLYRIKDNFSIYDINSSAVTLPSDGSAVVRSNMPSYISASGSYDVIALANADGNISLYPTGGAKRVIAASRAGSLRLSGSIEEIHLTGSAKMSLSTQSNAVYIMSENAAVTIDSGSRIETLVIAESAKNASVIINGTVENLTVFAQGAKVTGTGKVQSGTVAAADCFISVKPGGYSPFGNTAIEISAPEAPAGDEALTASAAISGAPKNLTMAAQWYQNGVPEKNASNPEFFPENGSQYTPAIRFLPDTNILTVGFSLQYAAAGAFEYRYASKSIDLTDCLEYRLAGVNELITTYQYPSTVLYDNYLYTDKSLTTRLQFVSGGAAVTCINSWGLSAVEVKLADGTVGWMNTAGIAQAVGNHTRSQDYAPADKELWINNKNYTSKTDYLAWVSLSCQKVNVFQRTDGAWRLIKTMPCAAGANTSPTPVGQYEISYHVDAWRYDGYWCGPVTGFYNGYAFHSWLNTYEGGAFDHTMGMPVSHGCIRLQDADAKYMYNLPMGSRVIVF